MHLPNIETKRLILRPFNLEDAEEVQRLAGDVEIAKTTLNIPHPYEDRMAEEWIGRHVEEYEKGNGLALAITHREEKCLIGAIGLIINKDYDIGSLGYWIGKTYWNKGYCTEAAKAICEYGFQNIGLHKIYATHLKINPASGKVMQKIGMKQEGILKEHVKKWGKYEDLVYYGMLEEMDIIIKEMNEELFLDTAKMITDLMNYHRRLNDAPKEYWQTDEESVETLKEWCEKGKIYNIFNCDEVVGFFYMKFGGQNVAWLEDLYIIEDCRRKGIGKIAMSKLDELMIEKGVAAMFVDIIPRNTSAFKFYRECGFDHLNLIQLRKNYDVKLNKDDDVEILGFNFKKY